MSDSVPAHALLRALVERRYEKNQALAADFRWAWIRDAAAERWCPSAM